ncbi:hypothetical protein BT96DRAFT_923059 [Gymnopus androsaceus JB14]|uniref:U1-type domain-containing protein n=1 Tax=Gymnopus androsaceus JB14 TaxID=1447944 RepID=A0A6A4HBL9_9AGAR|nr:hypothetical protein BT96DRAFT_923059 [Gymnopus androsaceus JB14]
MPKRAREAKSDLCAPAPIEDVVVKSPESPTQQNKGTSARHPSTTVAVSSVTASTSTSTPTTHRPTEWYCTVCTLKMNISSKLSHIAGKRHQKASQALTAVPGPTIPSESDVHLQGTSASPVTGSASTLTSEWYCTVCTLKMNISSKTSHIAGKRHQKVSQASTAAPPSESESVRIPAEKTLTDKAATSATLTTPASDDGFKSTLAFGISSSLARHAQPAPMSLFAGIPRLNTEAGAIPPWPAGLSFRAIPNASAAASSDSSVETPTPAPAAVPLPPAPTHNTNGASTETEVVRSQEGFTIPLIGGAGLSLSRSNSNGAGSSLSRTNSYALRSSMGGNSDDVEDSPPKKKKGKEKASKQFHNELPAAWATKGRIAVEDEFRSLKIDLEHLRDRMDTFEILSPELPASSSQAHNTLMEGLCKQVDKTIANVIQIQGHVQSHFERFHSIQSSISGLTKNAVHRDMLESVLREIKAEFARVDGMIAETKKEQRYAVDRTEGEERQRKRRRLEEQADHSPAFAPLPPFQPMAISFPSASAMHAPPIMPAASSSNYTVVPPAPAPSPSTPAAPTPSSLIPAAPTPLSFIPTVPMGSPVPSSTPPLPPAPQPTNQRKHIGVRIGPVNLSTVLNRDQATVVAKSFCRLLTGGIAKNKREYLTKYVKGKKEGSMLYMWWSKESDTRDFVNWSQAPPEPYAGISVERVNF